MIIGAESGPHARPFDLAWARSAIAQCRAAGVPCFVKQLGARPIAATIPGPGSVRQRYEEEREHFIRWPNGTWFGNPTTDSTLNGRIALLRDRGGRDPKEWPEDLRVREWPR